MTEKNGYDILFLGHYTRDTIVGSAGTRVVDGGAFYYGASVAARLGLKAAAITRLAAEDFRIVDELEGLGVKVFARRTRRSTCLRLVYPSENLDERMIYMESSAGSFSVDEVRGFRARTAVLGGSVRGEIPLEVVEALAAQGCRIALDVQGYVRVARENKLVYENWPEHEAVLAMVDILKTDAVEAEMLTGSADIHRAAKMLRTLGPAEVLITHRDGVLVREGNRVHEAVFLPRRLVGRSGRGDTCLSAYAGRRLTDAPAEALLWAAAVTSLKLEADGPFRGSPAEVQARALEIRACEQK
jgi:sugar/nucleoside kinase (ribokinase family)